MADPQADAPAPADLLAGPGQGRSPRRRRRVPVHVHALLVACVVALVGSSWMSTQVSSPNERTRVYLTHAIVTRAQLRVSPEWQRWGQIFDIAHRDGEFYSDKAPGSSVLAIPAVALTLKLNPQASIGALVHAGRWGVMLPATLLGAWAFLQIMALLGVPVALARVGCLALWCASPALHYGHAFFGHGLVLSTSLLALWAVLGATQRERPRERAWRMFLGGLMCGLCFALEYQAALISVCLGLGLLADARTRHWRVWWPLALGALPGVALVFAYNAAAFGHPLSTSYDHLYFQVSRHVHDVGISGVGTPKADAILGLLYSPARGLLFSSPWLLGACALWRRAADADADADVDVDASAARASSGWSLPELPRWLTLTCALIMAAYFYVVSSFGVWTAGWGQGPRLLLPMLGAGAVLATAGAWRLMAERRSGWLGAWLGFVLSSAACALLLKLTFPENPELYLVPARDIALPLLREGALSPNVWTRWLGLSPRLGAAATCALALVLWALVARGLRAAWAAPQSAPQSAPERVTPRPKRRVIWGAALLVSALWWGLMWSYPQDAHTGQDPAKHVRWVKALVAKTPR